MRVSLEAGKLLRVMGPANIVIESGRVRILGAEYSRGSRVLIHRFRSYVIKAVEHSVVSISLGEGASIEEPAPGEEVVDYWEDVANRVTEHGRFVAVVTGPVDSGKTSLATMIANVALSKGLKTAIIDIDVGQGDLAPPSFIAMKIVDKPVVWLRELRGDYMYFVGHVTPVHNPYYTRVLSGARRLLEKALSLGAYAVVVNTGGWVTGLSAVEMKLELVSMLRATHVIALDDKLCKRLSSALEGFAEVLCAPRPKIVRERSRSDRKMLRKHQYLRFFESARRVCIDLDSVALIGSCIASGIESNLDAIPEELRRSIQAIKVFEHDDIVVVIGRREPRADVIERLRSLLNREVYIVTPNVYRGLLCSLVKDDRHYPAILDDIDFEKRRACFITSYQGEVDEVIFGRIRITEEWEEITRVPRCPV